MSFVVDFLLGKTKGTTKRHAHPSPSELPSISEHQIFPYEDLWRSAIRCKMIYQHHNHIKNLWDFVNRAGNTLEAIDAMPIDEAYLRELRNTSPPVHFDTRSDKKSYNYNTSVYMWQRENTIYITFHVDIHIEKDFLKRQKRFACISDNIYVNHFFYKELLLLLKPILAHIEFIKNHHSPRSFQIVVAGYSLGGIIAQIASAMFSQMFSPFHFYVCCHTFGSPKAGNRHFVRWFHSYVHENYRIVKGNDPITMYPIDCQWCHVSRFTLQFDMDLHMNITQKELPWYKRLWTNHLLVRKILKHHKKDHNFDTYIQRLWNYTRITKYVEHSSQTVTIPLTDV